MPRMSDKPVIPPSPSEDEYVRQVTAAERTTSFARRYDLTNDVLSLGQDRAWRREVVAAIGVAPGERVLDLAAGTGTSSQPFADRGAEVVPCDFSLGMLRVGKQAKPHLGGVP